MTLCFAGISFNSRKDDLKWFAWTREYEVTSQKHFMAIH